MQSFNPATNELLFEHPETTILELQKHIKSLNQEFKKYKKIPFERRSALLEEYGRQVKEKELFLAELISKEVGKPLWEAKTEIAAVIAKIAISIEAYKERCHPKNIVETHQTLKSRFKPHGVVAVFGPFNFPAHLPNGHIVPALLAGNAILFKPSEFTPSVGNELFKILKNLGFPIEIVFGGPSLGEEIVKSEEIAGYLFTGSVKVGCIINENLAKTPNKLLALELGGNNPLVVSEVDDIDAAINLTIQSAFLTTGQRCTAARRLILPKTNQRDLFLKALIDKTKKIKIGAYNDKEEPFMGPLINVDAMKKVLKEQEALLLKGGKALLKMEEIKKGYPFLSPGIIDTTHVELEDGEVFGPLLRVILVDTIEEAIIEANKTKYGLSASLFSQSQKEWELFLEEVNAGVINWNTPTTGATSQLPFGGIGLSGNYRPSGYFAADYCSYPVASSLRNSLENGKKPLPGISPP